MTLNRIKRELITGKPESDEPCPSSPHSQQEQNLTQFMDSLKNLQRFLSPQSDQTPPAISEAEMAFFKYYQDWQREIEVNQLMLRELNQLFQNNTSNSQELMEALDSHKLLSPAFSRN